ncbi:MAG: hypothetical protein ABIQ93_00005 [Saprospiraceae bacterium]
MLRILLLVCSLFLSFQFLSAQTDCEKVLLKGKQLMSQKKYDDALNQFWAALVTCQGESGGEKVSALIKQTQEAYIKDLEDAVIREKIALQEALLAKSQAETAKQKEEIARREAELNAQRAREQGIRAESRRLALLADNVRSKGQKSDALLLAYLALRLSGESATQAPLMRAFGEAVRDSFTAAIFEGKIPIEQIQSSPDGQYLLVKLTDQSLHLLHVSDRKTWLLVPPGKQLLTALFSLQGNQVLTWAGNAAPHLWKTDGSLIAVLEGHTEAVRSAVFAPDFNGLVTCSRDNSARLWNNSGQLLATLSGHTGNVYNAAFSPSGKYILTRSSDGTARIWSRAGQFLSTIGSADQYLYDAKPSGDSLFITAEADGKVCSWNPEGKFVGLLHQHEGAARELLCTQNGKEVLSRGADRVVHLHSIQPGLGHTLAHSGPVSGFSISRDESRLLTWTEDFTIRLWDLASGQTVQTFPGHKGKILAAAFSPDQQYILSSAKDGSAKLWDAGGNVLMEWIINPSNPLPALLLPDGLHIAVADPTSHSLLLAPFPQTVFQKMDATTDLNGPLVAQLAKRYNVQFLGEISQ